MLWRPRETRRRAGVSWRLRFRTALPQNTLPPMSTAEQPAAAPVQSQAGAVRHKDVTLQIGSGSQTVDASKAELSFLSSVLREAFAIEPSCNTLKVDGSVEAWQFVASYPFRSSGERLAALPHNNAGAQTLAQLLAIAKQYDMPVVTEEAVEAASRWGHIHICSDNGYFYVDTSSGDHPAWWVDLADQYGRLELAAPAITAALRATAVARSHGSAFAATMRHYARNKQCMVWRTFLCMLQGL